MSESTQTPPVEPVVETQTTEIPEEEPKYSKAEFEKVLREAKKYKDMAKDQEKKNKDREIQELQKNNEWQRIAEMSKKEAEDAITDRDNLRHAVIKDKRMSAIREAALSAGLRKEAIDDLDRLDFPEIKLETNSEGVIIVSGADKAVMRLKSLKSYMFNSAAPAVSTQSPQVTNSGTNISWAEFKKIESEYKKSPTRENENKLKLAYSKVSV